MSFGQSYLYEYVTRILGNEPTGGFNLLPLLVAAAAAVAMAPLCRWLYSIPPNLRRYDPNDHRPRFNGMRGLLIVVAIIILLEPFRVIVDAVGSLYLFRDEVWQAMVADNPGGGWFGAYIIFNAAMFSVRLMLANTVALALINRRRMFRSLAIGYLALLVFILLVNDLFLVQYLPRGHNAVIENFRALAGTTQLAIIMVPYFVFSRRVHATFSG